MATTIELRTVASAKVDAQASRINLTRAAASELLARECAQGRSGGRLAIAADALLAAYRAADAVACERERIQHGGHSPVAFARILLATKHAVHAAMVAQVAARTDLQRRLDRVAAGLGVSRRAELPRLLAGASPARRAALVALTRAYGAQAMGPDAESVVEAERLAAGCA